MIKLYIDVTQLLHWPGKLTGIPRVMNELTDRYARNKDCVFVIWDSHKKQYYEADIQSSLLNRGTKIHYQSTFVANLPNGSSELLGKGKRTLRYMPGKRTVRKLLKPALHAGHKKINLYEGSTLFILWGEQQDQGFIKHVINLHKRKVKLVQITYDVLPLLQPQYSGHSTESMENYNTEIIPLCDLVLSISDHTKKDLTSWLKSKDLVVPRIEFFRLGDDFMITDMEKPRSKAFEDSMLKGGDYILCVGTVEARKNHVLLYYAYKLAKQRKVDLPKLIIVGRRGYRGDDIYEIALSDPDTKDKMIFLTDTSDEELSWLYENCLYSVYPSFYEGWGLPIAESLSRRVPCICSNTSSMPEVAGDLVGYFSPASSDECLSAMTSLLDPSSLEEARGRAKLYKQTTWDHTFKQVNELIEGVS